MGLADVEYPPDVFSNLTMIVTEDIHYKPRLFISEL